MCEYFYFCCISLYLSHLNCTNFLEFCTCTCLIGMAIVFILYLYLSGVCICQSSPWAWQPASAASPPKPCAQDMVITLSFYKCHFRIWRFKPLISATLGTCVWVIFQLEGFSSKCGFGLGERDEFFDLFIFCFLFLYGAFLCLYYSVIYFIFLYS